MHLTRLSAVRETYPDRERASRSSLLACCPQDDASGSRGRTPSSEDTTGWSTSPHSSMGCRFRSTSLPVRRDGRSSRTAKSHPTGCRRTQCPPFQSVARRSPLFRSPSGCHSRMAVGTSSYRVRTIEGSSPAPPRSPSSPVARPLRTVVAHAIPASWRAAASFAGFRRYGRPLPLASSPSRADRRPSADFTRTLGSAECRSDGLISSRSCDRITR